MKNKIPLATDASGMKRQRTMEIKRVVNNPLIQTREKLDISWGLAPLNFPIPE